MNVKLEAKRFGDSENISADSSGSEDEELQMLAYEPSQGTTDQLQGWTVGMGTILRLRLISYMILWVVRLHRRRNAFSQASTRRTWKSVPTATAT